MSTFDLGAEAVESALATKRFGRAYVPLRECPSTNDHVALLARQGAPEGLVVSAETQSAGRGRLGRSWHSPAGQNLYVSILLRPPCRSVEIPPLTLLVGGALAQAVRQTGVNARLKWPNDLLVEEIGNGPAQAGAAEPRWRKVAGILTEAATEGERVLHVVVGIGLNVNVEEFPADLVTKATSLRRVTGRTFSRAHLLASLLASIEGAYDQFLARGAKAAIDLWEGHAHLGQRCRAQGTHGEVEGVTAGVGAGGELLIRDADGAIHKIVSGEVIPVD